MDAKELRSELENRRQKNDVQGYRLEMIGKRVTLSKTGYKRCTKAYPVRGIVTCFSRRARSRRLRRIAEVNWREAGKGIMLTLTYPDDQADHKMEERKQHRYSINRSICRWHRRQYGCFWRVEWMPRLSGRHLGKLMPHMHLLYLGMEQLDEEKVRGAWKECIGAKQRVQVDVRELSVGEMVACYVSKYCSKDQDDTYLDNVPKRNRCGRHAGEWRRDLIPLHQLEIVRQVDDAIVRFLRGRACETLWWYDPRFDEGFTVLGDEALNLIRDIHENYLDVTKVIA